METTMSRKPSATVTLRSIGGYSRPSSDIDVAALLASTVWQVAVGGLELAKVEKVLVPAGDPLERDEVGECADGCLDAIYTTSVRASEKLVEAERRRELGEQVEVTMRRGEMNLPAGSKRLGGHRRPVGTRGSPLGDQATKSLDAVGSRRDDGIHVAGRSYDSVPDQSYPADQDIADARTIQVFEDAAEAGHPRG